MINIRQFSGWFPTRSMVIFCAIYQLGSIERPMAMKKRGTGVAVAAQAEGLQSLRRTVSGW